MGAWTSLIHFLKSNGLTDHVDQDGDTLVIEYKEGRGSFVSILSKYNLLLLDKANAYYVEGYSPSDLYQELALKLFQCCSSWSSEYGVSFTTYLYRSLENHLNRLVRTVTSKKRLSNIFSISYEALLLEPSTLNKPMVSEEFIRLEEPQYEEVRFSLIELLEVAKLSEEEEICVEMIMEGHRYKDIAERLGVKNAYLSKLLRGLRPRFEYLMNG